MGTFWIVHTLNSSPLRSNLLVVPLQQLLEGPMEVLICEHVNDLHHREQGLDYRDSEELS